VKTRTAYYSRRVPLRDCEQRKAPHRTRMVHHLQCRHYGGPLVYFGLPGVDWIAERFLDRGFLEARFVGVEDDPDVYDRSVMNLDFRGGAVELGEHCSRAPGVELHLARASHYLAREPVHRFNAFWLDTTAKIGADTRLTLQRLCRWLDYDVGFIPFGLTATMGRESIEEWRYLRVLGGVGDRPVDVRARAVVNVLEGAACRRVELLDAWSYKSAAGSTIANCTGLIWTHQPPE
jgi:hypothetical protein